MPRKKKKPAPSTIRVMKNRGAIDVSVLLREGCIIDLEIGRWRAEQKILPEDIGLEGVDEAQLRKYMTLGKKTLIPPELQRKLNSIESCARTARLKYTFGTPFGRFCPASSFKPLAEEMKRYETDWFKACGELCLHMKAHQKEVTEGYRKLAEAVYAQMRNQDEHKQKYASRYAKRIIKAIPNSETIKASFHFYFQALNTPDVTILDSKIRERILSEEASLEKLKTIRQSEEKVRKFNDEMRDLYEKNKTEKFDKFLNDINRQVRSTVAEVALAANSSLKKNKQLIGKTASQLKNVVTRFRMLNILNDTEIEKHINEIEKILKRPPSEKRNLKERDAELSSVLTALHREAMNVKLELTMPKERTPRPDILAPQHLMGIGRERRTTRSML